MRGEGAAKRLGKCCREMVKALTRITHSCAQIESPGVKIIEEDIYKDGTISVCADLVIQMLNVSIKKFLIFCFDKDNSQAYVTIYVMFRAQKLTKMYP